MISSKRFVRRILPRMGISISAGSTGSVVAYVTGSLATPVVGTIAGPVAGAYTERLLHWVVGQFSDIYREAEGTIFDRVLGGSDKLDYNSVSQFWTWIE